MLSMFRISFAFGGRKYGLNCVTNSNSGYKYQSLSLESFGGLNFTQYSKWSSNSLIIIIVPFAAYYSDSSLGIALTQVPTVNYSSGTIIYIQLLKCFIMLILNGNIYYHTNEIFFHFGTIFMEGVRGINYIYYDSYFPKTISL